MATLDLITGMISELSPEDKLEVLKYLRKQLLPPEECPDYIIYDVGRVHTLFNDDMMTIIWNEMRKMELASEILYMVHAGSHYMNVRRDSDTGSFGEHPEARKIMDAIERTGNFNGIMVKHDTLKPECYFVEAVMECAYYGRLNTEPASTAYLKIMVDGVEKTVVWLHYNAEVT
jgi:hypothetical protein